MICSVWKQQGRIFLKQCTFRNEISRIGRHLFHWIKWTKKELKCDTVFTVWSVMCVWWMGGYSPFFFSFALCIIELRPSEKLYVISSDVNKWGKFDRLLRDMFLCFVHVQWYTFIFNVLPFLFVKHLLCMVILLIPVFFVVELEHRLNTESEILDWYILIPYMIVFSSF